MVRGAERHWFVYCRKRCAGCDHPPRPVLTSNLLNGKIRKIKILFATDGPPTQKCQWCSVFDSFSWQYRSDGPGMWYFLLTDIPERFALEINDKIKQMWPTPWGGIKGADENTRERPAFCKNFITWSDLGPLGRNTEGSRTLNADIIAVGSSGMRGIKECLAVYQDNESYRSVLTGK
jgi:hypothetical protein